MDIAAIWHEGYNKGVEDGKREAEAALDESYDINNKLFNQANNVTADNRRLQEQLRELAEIALNWIASAQQARGSIFGPHDEVDYESAKQRVFALQHKEGE